MADVLNLGTVLMPAAASSALSAQRCQMQSRRRPAHYVQFDDIKDLVSNVAEVSSIPPAPLDEQSQKENRDVEHVHPLLRTHRGGSKSEIPVHPLLRSSPRQEPPPDNRDHPLLSSLPPARSINSNATANTRAPQYSHRRSHSVPIKNGTTTVTDQQKATSATASANAEDSILDSLAEKLSSHRNKYGDAHPKVAKFFNLVGNHNFRQAKYETALESYENALRCFKLVSASSSSSSLRSFSSRGDDTSISIAATLGNIGTVCWRMGRLQDAVKALKEAVSMAEKDGEESPEVANLLFTLGMAHSLDRDFEGAIECFAHMKRIVSITYGTSHVEVARAVDAMGKVYMLKGDPERAIRCHSDALRVKQKTLGSNHFSVLQTQMNLAAAYRTGGMFPEALAALHDVRSARKVALYRESDRDKRRALAADIGDTVRLIGEVQKEMNHVDENSSMDTIAEDQEEC